MGEGSILISLTPVQKDFDDSISFLEGMTDKLSRLSDVQNQDPKTVFGLAGKTNLKSNLEKIYKTREEAAKGKTKEQKAVDELGLSISNFIIGKK